MRYLLIILALSGCKINDIIPDDYKFGDISKGYCSTKDPFEKAQLKFILTSAGLEVGVDYCFKVEMADALIGGDE